MALARFPVGAALLSLPRQLAQMVGEERQQQRERRVGTTPRSGPASLINERSAPVRGSWRAGLPVGCPAPHS